MRRKLKIIIFAIFLSTSSDLYSIPQNMYEASRQIIEVDVIPESMALFDIQTHKSYSTSPWLNTHSQSITDIVYLVDSAMVSMENGSQVKHIYTHNENGSITSDLRQELTGTLWQNKSLNSYEYDENENMISNLYKTWEDSSWLNIVMHTYTFDGNANLDTMLTSWWQDSTWYTNSRLTYSRDNSENVISFLLERVNDSEWVASSLTTFEYDDEGSIILDLREVWSDSTWINYHRYTYTYNAIGNQTNRLYEFFADSVWVYVDRATRNYDGRGKLNMELNEHWSIDSTWENSTRSFYDYENSEFISTVLTEEWNGSEWINQALTTYGYDNYGNVTSILKENWNSNAWAQGDGWFILWDHIGNVYQYIGAVIDIFYTTVTTNIEEQDIMISQYCLSQNFPNPFNPSTTIRYGLAEAASLSLVIYDVRGQVVQTLESGYHSAGWYDVVWNGETVDGKSISTGIYFARLVAGDYSQVIKMLYLK